MVVSRRHARGRVLVLLAASATLVLASCGGGGSSKASSTPSTSGGGGDAATTTTSGGGGGSGGNGKCFSTPGKQTARVRFVNLFTNATYPSGGVDVWQGFSATDSCGKKLATVPYGTASDYIDVTAADESGNWEVSGFPAGVTKDEDHQIISQSETWKGGEQVTIVFMGQDPTSGNGPSAGSDQAFFEKPTTDESSLPAAPAGKAILAIGAASTQYTVKDGAWHAGVTGVSGCLKSAEDTENTSTSIGGTSQIVYPVDPGSLSLSLYRTSDTGVTTCTGKVDIGPATVDAAAGSRTLVFGYGPDATHLKLLVLPIAP